MEEVKKEALRTKRMGTVRKEMMHLTQKRALDECCGAYPNHTSDMVLDQFMGKYISALTRASYYFQFFFYPRECAQND